MNRRKRTLAIVSLLLALLITLPCWLVYQQSPQERKDQALIAAIKARDNKKTMEALAEGADGKTALDFVTGETDPNSRKVAALLRKYGAK